MRALFSRYLTIALLASLTAACTGTSQPSRFYLLSELPEANAASYEAAEEEGIALGIGPITVAPYLDRPQIIRRESRNKVDLSEFDRWAGTLKEQVGVVMALNLAHLLSTQRVAVHPWPRFTPIDYQILVHLLHFDADETQRVILRAHWMVLSRDGREIYAQRISDIQQQANAADFEAIAAAQSSALGELSQDIAAVIKGRKR